jgi:hypothetical protein
MKNRSSIEAKIAELKQEFIVISNRHDEFTALIQQSAQFSREGLSAKSAALLDQAVTSQFVEVSFSEDLLDVTRALNQIQGMITALEWCLQNPESNTVNVPPTPPAQTD